jgi:hypothetical protein
MGVEIGRLEWLGRIVGMLLRWDAFRAVTDGKRSQEFLPISFMAKLKDRLGGEHVDCRQARSSRGPTEID